MPRYLLPLLLVFLSACTSTVQTNPDRSAVEEMLISTAAERAAARLAFDIPKESRVFVDHSFIESDGSSDYKYAIAAIRAHLLEQGAALTDDKKEADIVIETRAGALSTDQRNTLVGIPEFSLPLPLASTPITTPEIALYAADEQKGTAKLAMVAYEAKDGKQIASVEPKYGFSHNTKRTVLIFISWTDSDYMPEDVEADESEKGKLMKAIGGPARS